ncbi:MAG TPA: hypothetical protein VGL23_13295 [Chloroflexota bacterium]|jgi:hypothetical protein
MSLRKGLALAIVWADVPPAGRPAFESWAASQPIGDPGGGVLSAARYVAVSGAPSFIELHELADVEAEHERAQRATLAALAEAGASPVRGLYRQIFPPGLDERAAVHGPPPALQIGRIDIPPEHEEEFNEWYNGEYLVGYLKIPGVYGARRYLNQLPGPRYLTVYELANDQVSRQPEWDRVRAQSVWRRRIERFWTHADGSPGIYRRLQAPAP